MEVALKPRSSLAQKLLSEFHYVTSLAYHTLSSPLSLSTLHQTITIERPNYPPSHTFLLNLMKTVLSYEHHNLTRSNFFMSFFERWIVNPLVPYWRLEIRHFEFSVDSRVLHRDVVEAFNRNPNCLGGYRIPEELSPQPEYKLTGEYLTFNSTIPQTSRVILYLHGGGFFACSAKMHRSLTWRYARETNTRLFALNYRLAPTHPFPAALYDAYAAFLYLTCPHHPAFRTNGFFNDNTPLHNPVRPEDVILMGDSAGGGLCLSLLALLRDVLGLKVKCGVNGGLERSDSGCTFADDENTYFPDYVPKYLPGACVLFSPWVDMTMTCDSWDSNSHTDFLPHLAFSKGGELNMNPVYWYIGGNKQGVSKLLKARKWFINDNENFVQEEEDVDNVHVEEYSDKILKHPLLSPLFIKDWSKMPPILIQAGDAEVLRDETLFLAHKINHANSDTIPNPHIRHELYKDMPHVFQFFTWLPISLASITNVGVFIRNVYDKTNEEGVGEGLMMRANGFKSVHGKVENGCVPIRYVKN